MKELASLIGKEILISILNLLHGSSDFAITYYSWDNYFTIQKNIVQDKLDVDKKHMEHIVNFLCKYDYRFHKEVDASYKTIYYDYIKNTSYPYDSKYHWTFNAQPYLEQLNKL